MEYAFQRKFEALSDFYGFIPVCVPFVRDARAAAPLIKAKMAERSDFLFAKTSSGQEFALFPPANISILFAYAAGAFTEAIFPLKMRVHGHYFTKASPGERGSPDSFKEEWSWVTIGEPGPIAEAEIVQVLWQAFQLNEEERAAGSLKLRVNANGCTLCAGVFRSSLAAHLRSRAGRLCKKCKRVQKNEPMDIFVCGEEKCKMVAESAPQVLDFLCDTCKKHLRGFLEFLDEIGIPYVLDPRFSRDHSPFQSFIFELAADVLSGEGDDRRERIVLAEGGRLSRAAELIAGRPTDAVAGAVRAEAVARFARARIKQIAPKVFFAQLGELAKRKSFVILELLRSHGIDVQQSLGKDAVKSQLKIAERIGAPITLILGQKEALDATIIVREMDSGIQEIVSQEKLIEFVRRKFQQFPQ